MLMILTRTTSPDEAAAVLAMLPPDFGSGWMTASARDLVRIAVYVAGFDAEKLMTRLGTTGNWRRGGNVNARTVERVLREVSHDN